MKLRIIDKALNIRDEMFELAAEMEPERAIMREHYRLHPPPPPIEPPPPEEYDELMQIQMAQYRAGFGRHTSRHGLDEQQVKLIRAYMAAHRGMSLATMERETSICASTFRKYGSDLLVR
jgi:hypothetical protein